MSGFRDKSKNLECYCPKHKCHFRENCRRYENRLLELYCAKFHEQQFIVYKKYCKTRSF